MDELTPGITPPVAKVNPENELFDLWDKASPEDRPAIEWRMMPALRRHAAKVCWMCLHSHQPHLVEEIAQDAIMDLHRFKKESAFSTWFHSRALGRCRVEFRKLRLRKEVPIDYSVVQKYSNSGTESSGNSNIFVQQIISKLSPAEQKLIRLKIFEGMTDEEASKELGLSRTSIQIQYSKLRKKLKEQYNGAF